MIFKDAPDQLVKDIWREEFIYVGPGKLVCKWLYNISQYREGKNKHCENKEKVRIRVEPLLTPAYLSACSMSTLVSSNFMKRRDTLKVPPPRSYAMI